MEKCKRRQIPAFGNWNFNNNLPITQYLESAREGGFIRYNQYLVDDHALYQIHRTREMTPAIVSQPKVKRGSKRYHVRETKKVGRVCDEGDQRKNSERGRVPKAVDEDLYKIPPELLCQKPTKRRGVIFLWKCLLPTCIS